MYNACVQVHRDGVPKYFFLLKSSSSRFTIRLLFLKEKKGAFFQVLRYYSGYVESKDIITTVLCSMHPSVQDFS